MRRAVWAAAALAVAAPAAAVAQEPAADTTGVHVVRRGDTLWDLARQYLENPFRWPDIFRLNPDVVEDPDLIFPRERLRIPGLAGRRPLGEPARGAAGERAGDLRMQAEEPAPRTVFFPRQEMDGRTLMGPADTPSPAVAPGEFYSAGLLVPENRVRPVGRLAEVLAPTVIPGGVPNSAQPYERVYMAVAAPGSVARGDRLHLMREGRRIPGHGRIFESTGIATVVEVQGGTATLEVQEHFEAVEVGNFAVPLPDYRVPIGTRPAPAVTGAQGRLLAFQFPQPVPGIRDLGFVDLGRDAGLVEGDELEAVLPSERRSWGVRPEIVVARLQVVRVAERTSAVQVVSMDHPALEPGVVVRLVGKMPSS